MPRTLGGVLVLISAACSHPNAPTCPTPPAKPDVATEVPAPIPPPTRVEVPVPVPTPISGYDKPPQAILDVLHAGSPARPMINAHADTILLVSWVDYPSIAQVSEPYLKLAGVRVEPRTRRKHDTPGGYGVAPCARSFGLVDVATSRETPVQIPPGCIDGIAWSPDGTRFAFRNTTETAVELWIGDGKTGAVKRLGDSRLNPMLGSAFAWLADGHAILAKLVPDNAGAPPVGSAVADGPEIQESDGKSGESSTYETRDTLKNKHDEDLFEYYGTSQLAVVDVATGAATRIGKPGVYTDVDTSPDDRNILVSRITKPYSYIVTYGRFPYDVEIWDRAGKLAKAVAHLPLAERVPIRGVSEGPRGFGWRADEPATLLYAEALDHGDWNVKVPQRDKVMSMRAPFADPATEFVRTEQRYAGLAWTEDKNLALLSDFDENRHWKRTFTMNPNDPKAKPAVLFDLSSDEHYKDPGAPIYRQQANRQWLVRLDKGAMFLRGTGSSPDGDHPYLDREDLASKQVKRLWQSGDEGYETFVAFTDDTNTRFLGWHQSPMDPPNGFLHVVGDAAAKQVTHVPDPTPAVRKIKKRLVKYKRKDGLDLSFTLYTPPDYVEGTRVPAILYAYPLDFAQAKTAGQVTGSEMTFTTVRDYRLLLLSGYAIIDNAAFPIVGDPKKAYDTYLAQLVDDAQAAVDKAVATGIVDRERIGVTGHSHGALMTANLVAHTKLFKAGVATSGSYNKTLVPFGFQSERRSVWTSQKVYLDVSPFFVADKIKLPLLIVHGADDANPGTTPNQAAMLYDAIRGNGGTTRLVMLPHEPHWYAAMESNEQLAYEELRWFDKYVKGTSTNH